jgi:hypothetical protein
MNRSELHLLILTLLYGALKILHKLNVSFEFVEHFRFAASVVEDLHVVNGVRKLLEFDLALTDETLAARNGLLVRIRTAYDRRRRVNS